MMDAQTLRDELAVEIARIRNSVLPAYQEIGPAGGYAVAMMRYALDRAEDAFAKGDASAVHSSRLDLKGFEL